MHARKGITFDPAAGHSLDLVARDTLPTTIARARWDRLGWHGALATIALRRPGGEGQANQNSKVKARLMTAHYNDPKSIGSVVDGGQHRAAGDLLFPAKIDVRALMASSS